MRIIDPVTGAFLRKARAGEILRTWAGPDERPLVPAHVQELLDKSAEVGWQGPKMSDVGWRDTLTPKGQIARNGAQVLNTTTETIMLPDYTFAPDTVETGDVYKYTLFFDHSTVITTPGTITFRLRWGGAAGTSLAASGAFAPDPTAAGTTLTGFLQWYFVILAVGASGSAKAFGNMWLNDFDDASVAALVANLNMMNAPASAPAAVTIDTTAAKALSPTVQFSVATATTQLTNHLGILESLN